MARQLDQIIVIDIEATCWEGAPPPGQVNEIIEIGICPVDVVEGRCLPKRSILVRPEHSMVSPFCTQLTTLTQKQVDQGVSFAQACQILRSEYATKTRTWASYGDYDRRQFERQCSAGRIDYPFGSAHINIKNFFALVHSLPHEVGMEKALQILQIPLEGTHHRGDDDAANTGKILLSLLTGKGIAHS